MKTVEEIILQHSGRGMDILKEYLPADYCRQAAEEILNWPRGKVLLATGFYVKGFAETDGPAGTLALVLALQKLGFSPVVLTDEYCSSFFEAEDIPVCCLYPDTTEEECRSVLEAYRPVGLISTERCGKNPAGDYANMRGISIREHTAPVDAVFEAAFGLYPTLGIGDGGNEIGMGVLRDVISEKLSLSPCVVKTDRLIIASVSNWGAYGLSACLAALAGDPSVLCPAEKIEGFIRKTVEMGSVNGTTGEHLPLVDGFPLEVELGILEELRQTLIA